MSDIMNPIPFAELMNHILSEHRVAGAVFGVEKAYFADRRRRLPIFGEWIETPIGPAAGPHTQLAQNIVSAYYAGARFFELKTVQTMDGEDMRKCINKPCILARDEGYNCEWSTELTVEEAYNEYVKAWFMLKLISREFQLGSESGFMFNMSVGYTYDGIISPKIDRFIEGLKDAGSSPVFLECKKWAIDNISRFDNVNAEFIDEISPYICNSITLSTLHGCPPEEIERIAGYLISEKKLNTFVKCNPTILGYTFARTTLDQMGYDYVAFDEHHFLEDLQMADAVPMFSRLMQFAGKNNVEFGLKLSNTFPVKVTSGELPSEEMYMSGKPLYPLTIEMANRFTSAFDGRLRLSFSGGADAFNIRKLFSAGIWPITVATTVLKPGGYERFTQLVEKLKEQDFEAFSGVRVARTLTLANAARTDVHHTRPIKPIPARKIGGKIPLASCFTAPCKSGCPIGQDIPGYLALLGEGKYLKALELITDKNPLPFITGRICPHQCMDKCTRTYYEEPVRIRNAKLEVVRIGYEGLLGELKTPTMTSNERAAIIGGGPAGLSAAFFLGRAGVPVTLFEKREQLGGAVKYAIPRFRLPEHAVERDLELIKKSGVQFVVGKDAPSVSELRKHGYDYVILAVGASKPGTLNVEGCHPINALEFLEAFNNDEAKGLGEHVLVVGGGNTAMDSARAALRVEGVKDVHIVYRRTMRYMPASEEELIEAQREGVIFDELLSPDRLEGGKLICRKMELGEPDASGRRSPVETGEFIALPCDTLIAAIGEGIDLGFFENNGIKCENGKAAVNSETFETNIPGVFVLGDARRGPATVVEAIADAQKAADIILGVKHTSAKPEIIRSPKQCRSKRGSMVDYENASRECDRCLNCDISCELCVQVCPNRANVAITVPGYEQRQVLHIDRMCNECGNCAVFCPYDDDPYKAKLTLFHTMPDFDASENPGFLRLGDSSFLMRLDDGMREVKLAEASAGLSPDIEAILRTLIERYGYLFGA